MADDMGAAPKPGAASAAGATRAEAPRMNPPPTPGPQIGPGVGPAPAATSAPTKAARGKLRGRLFAGLGAAVVIAAVGYGAYWLLVGSHYVSTDNAYVGAEVAQITPQVSGQIAQVRVSDTQAVKAGDVLVVIDPADARLAEAQAQAAYGSAERRIQQDVASNSAFTAAIGARDADLLRAKAQLASAQADVDRTRIDLQRRQKLAASGAVSGEELTTAKNAYQTAIANLDATKAAGAQAQANRTQALSQSQAQAALTSGVSVDQNPEVLAAKAMLDTARLNLSRTVIRAPFDGVVSQRNVQVGQRVAVGAMLMTVVPVSKAYVDANFKEVQLRKVKPGQTAELTADLYGSGVKFHGCVVGFSGGTGSAFAVIPAQNATGNWIKVVQRLPVRVAIDPRDLRAHPLRVGLSMDTRIDIAGAADCKLNG